MADEPPKQLIWHDVQMAYDEYVRLVDRFYEGKCDRDAVEAAYKKATEAENQYREQEKK